MASTRITPKGQQILEFIRSYISRHQYAPTIAEIAQGVSQKSRGTVHRYLQQLVEANLLKILPNQQRNLALTPQGWQNFQQELCLPLLGKIAAGKPIEAVLNQEQVDFSRLLDKEHYVLKVCGNSMVEEGIFDGDLVICRHAQQAHNGDIVVALIDSAFATLKRFYRDKIGQITLKPANAELSPVTYPADRVEVQGIFMGLLRLT